LAAINSRRAPVIANNLFYDIGADQYGRYVDMGTGGSNDNNLSLIKIAKNLYFTGPGNPQVQVGIQGNIITFAQWQTMTCGGQGCDVGSLTVDPLLVNAGSSINCTWDPTQHSATGLQSCATAYTLQHGSPAFGAGANLRAAPYNLADVGTGDFFGNPIPAGAPNIGADLGAH
jgi:hypothetical protein